MTIKNCMDAMRAFIFINVTELDEPDYISRLSKAVLLMDNDENTFEVFTWLFQNEIVCDRMVKFQDELSGAV